MRTRAITEIFAEDLSIPDLGALEHSDNEEEQAFAKVYLRLASALSLVSDATFPINGFGRVNFVLSWGIEVTWGSGDGSQIAVVYDDGDDTIIKVIVDTVEPNAFELNIANAVRRVINWEALSHDEASLETSRT